MNKPNCGHTTLQSNCRDCATFQKLWYQHLKNAGFKDIEYGQDTVKLQDTTGKPLAQMLQQPVPIKNVGVFEEFVETIEAAELSTTPYDAAWTIYHQWAKDGRSKRDLTVCELYATQDNRTGTIRGISRYLKANKLKPWSTRMVQKTVNEIKRLINAK